MGIWSIERALRRAVGALALGVAGLVASAAPAAAEEVELGGGHADWGVKESFRNYVEGPIAHGEITVTDGATRNADGTFRFPVAGGIHDAEAAEAEVVLGGSVRFNGHDEGSGPQLDLTIADPRIVLEGEAGILHADVTSLSFGESEPVEYPDVAFGELDLTRIVPEVTEEGAAWDPIPAILSEEGAPAFADFYPAGTELDPVGIAATYGPSEYPPGGDPPGGDPPGGDPPGADPSDSNPPASPAAKAPVIRSFKRTRVTRRGRRARIGWLRCRTGPCQVDAPGRTRVGLGRKRARAKVLAPKRIGERTRRKLRVRLSRRAMRLLDRRRRGGRVRVPVTLRSGEMEATARVGVKLRGPR